MNIRSSLWFWPTVIALLAAVLAMGLIEADRHLGHALAGRWPRLFGAEVDGSLAMLSTIASSMITVAGVVFSVTIVALALASTQYTPRVLRTFMRDRANQAVLGVFVGIYVYCLFVLRTISNDGGFIPALAVSGGVVLAIIGIGVLIFFIHHIAVAIQASEIIAAVAHETIAAVDRSFPDELGQGEDEENVHQDHGFTTAAWQPTPALAFGYLQTVASDTLLAFAHEHDTVVRMAYGTGEFIVQGRPIAWLALDKPPDPAMIKAVNRIYAIDAYRTVDQDAGFGIRQLVDIALKALSPGINDTSTAVTCIEYLSVILRQCASRRIESPYRFYKGHLRVVAKGPTFANLVALSFDQILESAEGNTAVLVRMLTAIKQIGEVARNAQRRDILIRQVQIIAEVADRGVRSSYARSTIEDHVKRVTESLGAR